MIGLLKGMVELRDDPYILIDVSGVGYKVLVNSDILSSYQKGDAITLFTYTHVREDLLELYGFATHQDLKLFEQLISVSGVGPKTALGIFLLGSSEEIIHAIVKGNVSFFTGVSRLGKKNAQKIIIELKNKVGGIGDLDLSNSSDFHSDEVIETLQALGFTVQEAGHAIRAMDGSLKTTQEKVKFALKFLGK